MGITTLIELQLIQAKKYVKLEYHRTNNVHESIEKLRHEINTPENDYVDGIVFSKNLGVIMTGQLTDAMPDSVKPRTFSKPWDPWFYLHVKDKTLASN